MEQGAGALPPWRWFGTAVHPAAIFGEPWHLRVSLSERERALPSTSTAADGQWSSESAVACAPGLLPALFLPEPLFAGALSRRFGIGVVPGALSCESRGL